MYTIGDMIVRIRNGGLHKKEKVDIPSSKIKQEIARLLKEEGYITNYKVISDRKQGVLRIYLKYSADKTPVINEMKLVSKPGLRIYSGVRDIPQIMRGMGTVIVTTSRGLMTDRECRQQGMGGEVLFYIW